MTNSLEQLIDLARSMQALAADKALLDGVPDDMRALHTEYVEARTAIDNLVADVESAALERRKAEAAIADSQEKLRHFQQQVGQVRNQREYGALLTEIDTAKQQSKLLEDEALAALERADEIGKELEGRRAAFVELEQRHNEALAQWESEKPKVAERAAVHEADVERLRSGISRPILGHLQRIFDRYHGEVFAILGRVERPGNLLAIWHCSSCNYQIRPQVAVEIRGKGSIVQCEGCKRFLRPDDSV
ncbi:MAG: C4-type zinc ribbon domain-containing protein [Thermoanaerobaculia bacterium]